MGGFGENETGRVWVFIGHVLGEGGSLGREIPKDSDGKVARRRVGARLLLCVLQRRKKAWVPPVSDSEGRGERSGCRGEGLSAARWLWAERPARPVGWRLAWAAFFLNREIKGLLNLAK